MSNLMCSLVVGLLMISSLASAETYKWVGQDGKTYYSNSPPQGGGKSHSALKVYKDIAEPPPTSSTSNKVQAEQERQFRARREAAQREEEEGNKRAEIQRQACENAMEQVKLEQAKPARTKCCGSPSNYDYAMHNKRVNEAKKSAEAICSGSGAVSPSAPLR